MIKYTKLDLYKMTIEELNKVLEVFLRREDELMETTITVRAHSRVNLDEWPPV